MKKQLLVFIFILTAALWASEQKWADIGDFTLESGEVIIDCKIGYRTYGKLNWRKSNAVLFPTWFGGISEHLGNLVGEDKLIDSTKFFVIAIDALGDGVSSSPTNSGSQPNENFPLFTIRDMVNSQHKVLTEEMGIKKLHAIVGGSMGGMQTFQWLVSYPDFMDRAVPYVGAPWQTGYGRLVWETELLMIEAGLEHNMPHDIIAEQVALTQIMNAYTPAYRNRKTAPEDVTQFRADYLERFQKNFRIYDWASQLRAMIAHDITADFGGDRKKAAAAIQANLLIMVSATDHLVNPGPALELAELIDAETVVFDNDCGHLAPGCEREKFIKSIQDFISK